MGSKTFWSVFSFSFFSNPAIVHYQSFRGARFVWRRKTGCVSSNPEFVFYSFFCFLLMCREATFSSGNASFCRVCMGVVNHLSQTLLFVSFFLY